MQLFEKFSQDSEKFQYMLTVAYNELIINRVRFSYNKIFKPRSLRTDLTSSIPTTGPCPLYFTERKTNSVNNW